MARPSDGLTVTDVGDILPTDLGADGTLLVQRFTVDLPDGSDGTVNDDEATRRATPGGRGRWQLDGYLL